MFGRAKRQRNLARHFDELQEGVFAPHWRIGRSGQVERVEYEHMGFSNENAELPIIEQVRPRGKRIQMRDLVAGRCVKQVQQHFSADQYAPFIADLKSSCAQAALSLRDADLKGLVFQSHKLHRKAAVEGLRAVAVDEMAACLKARWPEITKAASADTLDCAFYSGEKIPRDARFVLRDQHTTFVVIEQMPTIRTLRVRFGDRVRTHDLAMPYVIFMIVVRNGAADQVLCAFSNSRLDSLDQRLWWPALPHVESGLRTCFGSLTNGETVDLDELCETVVHNFWNSEFIMREPGGHSHDRSADETFKSKKSQITSFKKWDTMTKEQGLRAALTNHWLPYEHTVQEIAQQYLAQPDEDAVKVADAVRDTVATEMARELLLRAAGKAATLPLGDELQGRLDAFAEQTATALETALAAKIKAFENSLLDAEGMAKVVDGAIAELFEQLES